VRALSSASVSACQRAVSVSVSEIRVIGKTY
jgi:hypothetical protein